MTSGGFDSRCLEAPRRRKVQPRKAAAKFSQALWKRCKGKHKLCIGKLGHGNAEHWEAKAWIRVDQHRHGTGKQWLCFVKQRHSIVMKGIGIVLRRHAGAMIGLALAMFRTE